MQCLTRKSLPPLQAGAEPAVRAQLERILGSAQFRASDRMRRFLGYVVAEALACRSQSLKEYSIGLRVFDRPEDFDPLIDPIVRVEARRLREKLARYYGENGSRDQILIEVPTGGYVPRFSIRSSPEAPASARPTLTVLPFSPATREAEPIGGILLFELVDQLVRIHDIRVRTGTPDWQQAPGSVFSGCIQTPPDRVRVVAHVTESPSNNCRWSTAVDEPQSDFAHEKLAASIARKLSEYLSGNACGRLQVNEAIVW